MKLSYETKNHKSLLFFTDSQINLVRHLETKDTRRKSANIDDISFKHVHVPARHKSLTVTQAALFKAIKAPPQQQSVCCTLTAFIQENTVNGMSEASFFHAYVGAN